MAQHLVGGVASRVGLSITLGAKLSCVEARGAMMSRHNAWRLVVVIFCVLSVAGCALGISAKRNYDMSRADYRACLEANSANVQACEDKRLTMEADERAYQDQCRWQPCL